LMSVAQKSPKSQMRSPSPTSSSGGGNANLRAELQTARVKMGELLKEKDMAQQNVEKIKKVLTKERTDLRMVLDSAKTALDKMKTEKAQLEQKLAASEESLKIAGVKIEELEEEIRRLLALLKASNSKSDGTSADLTQLKKGVTVLLEYSSETRSSFGTAWSALKGPSVEAIHPTRLQIEGLHSTIDDLTKRNLNLQKQTENERVSMISDFDEKMRKLRELHEKELAALRADGSGSSSAWEAERVKLMARVTNIETELSTSISVNSQITNELSTSASRMEQYEKRSLDMEAQMTELRNKLNAAEQRASEIEDRSRSDLQDSQEQTRQATIQGERNTAEQAALKEGAESEVANVRGLLSAAETELKSACELHLAAAARFSTDFEKAQSAFEAALALARRDGIEKSELQEEISRLRAELAQLTKTMEHRLSMAESMQKQAIEGETRCSASLQDLQRTHQDTLEDLSLLRQQSDGDLRSLRQENDTMAQSFKRNQDEYASLMTSAEQAAVTAADRIAQLEEKARLARSEHSSVVIESQTLLSKVSSLESSFSELQTTNTRLEGELTSVKESSERSNAQCRSLEQQLADMESEMTNLRDMLDSAARNLAAETEKLTGARTEAAALNSDKLRLTSELEDLKGKLEASQRMVGQLEGQLQTVKTELTMKSEQYVTTDSELQALRKSLTDELDTEKMRCSSLADRNTRFEEQNCELSSELDQLKALHAQLSADFQLATSNYNRVNQEMESWKSKYNQEVAALQAALERKSTELSSSQSECKNLQSELDAARLSITKLREELDNLRMKFERELAEAESRYNGLLSQNGASSEAQDRQISLLEQQIAALKAELAQAVDVEKDLRRQLEEQNKLSIEVTSTLTMLQSRFGTLEGQYKELGLRMVHERRYRAYACFREFVRIARAGSFVASFHLWAKTATESAMNRGAAELRDIVDDAGTRGKTTESVQEGIDSPDPWDIGGLDIHALAGEYGL